MAAFRWIQMSSLLILMLQFKGEDTTNVTTMTSNTTALTPSADTKSTISKANRSTTGTSPTTATPTKKINTRTTAALTTSADWLWLIIASVGLAAFLITVVMIIRWKKTKEKRQRGNNTGLSLNPADTQCGAGTSQDTAEADDGVSYASITFTKKTKNNAQARGDDDDDDTMTYSTVKASSSSTDHSGLYSTINKANKCS